MKSRCYVTWTKTEKSLLWDQASFWQMESGHQVPATPLSLARFKLKSFKSWIIGYVAQYVNLKIAFQRAYLHIHVVYYDNMAHKPEYSCSCENSSSLSPVAATFKPVSVRSLTCMTGLLAHDFFQLTTKTRLA